MTRHTASGDTGRRIAQRRAALGLTREQLGERAGMVTGYIEYLEESTADIPGGDLLRIATALETSVEELVGGGMDEPPGQGGPAADPRLRELGREECLRLIEPGGIGRVAWSGQGGPVVLPVNYKMHDGTIVFRTQRGGLIDEELSTCAADLDLKVGFEVDRIDEARREGWSVLVQGPAHRVTAPEEVAAVAASGLETWAGGTRDRYLRITPQQVTGRRIQGL